MRTLPALDLHAHIEAGVSARELESLGAVVWAATRSLAEYEQVDARRDAVTIWGLGCHPGVMAAQHDFDEERFAVLMKRTALVSEIGLDGRSKVPLKQQMQTFKTILQLIERSPRVTSVHSYRATSQVLDCIEQMGAGGVVLHWWLGDIEETKRALALGCYFSVNHAMTSRSDLLRSIPLDRLLMETDHPDGDRKSSKPRRPGAVRDVELLLARSHGTSAAEARVQGWRNLARIVETTHVHDILPPPVQRMLASVDRQ